MARRSRTRKSFPWGWLLACCVVLAGAVGVSQLVGSTRDRGPRARGVVTEDRGASAVAPAEAASGAPRSTAPREPVEAVAAPREPAPVRTVAASALDTPRIAPPRAAAATRTMEATTVRAASAPAGPARAAIVIDDCGERLDLMQRAVRIRAPLTFAVIPHLRASTASADLGFSAGHEVILHQPMEPSSPSEDPGQGVLEVGMKPEQVARVLRRNLDAVPHVVGLNNHMGSRATADEALMGHVLAATRGLRADYENLYFLDSRTSAETVGFEVARRQGVPTAMRDVFLDNDSDPVAIRKQLDLLIATAKAEGEAIGIGHLKPDTLAVLEAVLSTVPERECRFVFVSELVR